METYVFHLCRELQRRGHQSDVATLNYLFTDNKSLPAYQQVYDTNVIRLPSLGTARYFIAPRLLELVPRYDLIHVHGVDFFVDLLGVFRRVHGTPVVLSTHGGFFHTEWFPSFKKAYFNTMTRLALRGVDRVIACSPRDQELFAPLTSRLCLVENGIDYATFAALEKKPQGQSMIFIGRISKNKRIDRLIKVIARVREKNTKATLTIVGPDWEGLKDGLEKTAEELGISSAVSFTGELPQKEVLDALASARLFVSASDYEAFGLSAMEAMASGTVPVLNNIAAFQEFVESGVNGFLADFTDEDSAAETLLAALELSPDKLREIGARAKETASHYNWEKKAGEIIKIYKQVIASHKGKFA